MNTSLSPSWIGILLLLVVVVLFAVARRSVPADEAQGMGLVGDYPTVNSGAVLKIATFNIQTGKSAQGERNIRRAADTLKGVDVAGIQEVYAPSWLNRLGLSQPQTKALADIGQFDYGFHPTRKRWFIDHRGNALLSRVPVGKWYTKMLPDQSGKSFRNYTTAELLWNGHPLVVINTHLHTGVGRDTQLERVIEEFDLYPRAILMGDFNTTLELPALKALLARDGVVDAIGERQLDPAETERIDWIITKGFKVVGGRYLPRGVSDHPYYEVHLQIAN